MARRYNPGGYQKHKRPKGWGSLCPDSVDLGAAQALLDSGVRIGDSIYNVDGEFAFHAFQHEPGRWHGFPIPWSHLPNEARLLLIEAGRLDLATWRKATRRCWGQEFVK